MVKCDMPRQGRGHANKVRHMLKRLGSLRYFLSVMEFGTVREAARVNNITQPALTRHIKELEYEVGVSLFERSPNGMIPTKFAEILANYARQIDLNGQVALREIREISEGHSGVLRIGAGPAWAYSIVPDAIARLQAEMPKVEVELNARINEYTRLLSSAKLDCLVSEIPLLLERESQHVYEEIIDIRYLVFARAGHPIRKEKRISATALATYPWIGFSDSVNARVRLMNYFRDNRVHLESFAVKTTSFQSGLRLLTQNDYLMLLPHTLFPIAEKFDVFPLATRGLSPKHSAGIIRSENVARLKSYQRLRQHIQDVVREIVINDRK